jgi:hypothetical protein
MIQRKFPSRRLGAPSQKRKPVTGAVPDPSVSSGAAACDGFTKLLRRMGCESDGFIDDL